MKKTNNNSEENVNGFGMIIVTVVSLLLVAFYMLSRM